MVNEVCVVLQLSRSGVRPQHTKLWPHGEHGSSGEQNKKREVWEGGAGGWSGVGGGV